MATGRVPSPSHRAWCGKMYLITGTNGGRTGMTETNETNCGMTEKNETNEMNEKTVKNETNANGETKTTNPIEATNETLSWRGCFDVTRRRSVGT